jgi:hypothetical protein
MSRFITLAKILANAKRHNNLLLLLNAIDDH